MKTVNKEISMINWMDKSGNVFPIKFKIEDKNGAVNVIKIHNVHKIDTIHIAGTKTHIFTCEISLSGARKICEIRYDLLHCQWTLFKI